MSGDSAPAGAPDFLSGTSGEVTGVRAGARALLRDGLADGVAALQGLPWRLRRAAARWPARRILALGIEREGTPNVLASAQAELRRSHHHVTLVTGVVGGRGKFENLNALLEEHPAEGHDWVLLIDDDVRLPRGFLDSFAFLAERFGLRLAQPAHRHRSHAAWAVTRRRTGCLVRETAFVEIGPVVAMHSSTFELLLPFPPLRFGWGLDAHWSALAAERQWRIGVVDGTPIRHGLRPVAAAYSREEAIAEARGFLAGRAYTPAGRAQRTLAVHRTWT